MKTFFVAHSLSEPTIDTFEEVSKQRFKKIERLVPTTLEGEPELRLSAEKDGSDFLIHADLRTFKNGNYIAKTRNRDLRLAISECAKELKSIIAKNKDRIVSRKKSQEI
jgi:ribosome-associated translation inhibitor RaiA